MQPIGYADAEEILSRMGGWIAPNSWQVQLLETPQNRPQIMIDQILMDQNSWKQKEKP